MDEARAVRTLLPDRLPRAAAARLNLPEDCGMAVPRKTDQEIVEAILNTPTIAQAAKRIGYGMKYVSEIVHGRRRPAARKLLLFVSKAQVEQAHALLAKASGPAAARLLQMLSDDKLKPDERIAAARVVFGELFRREELVQRYAQLKLTATHMQSVVQRFTEAVDKVFGARLTREDGLRLATELRSVVAEDEPRVPFRRVTAISYTTRPGGDGDGDGRAGRR